MNAKILAYTIALLIRLINKVSKKGVINHEVYITIFCQWLFIARN